MKLVIGLYDEAWVYDAGVQGMETTLGNEIEPVFVIPFQDREDAIDCLRILLHSLQEGRS